MLEFKNVSYIYPKGYRALTNINLFIDKGEFVFLVGPVGAGKTTILKLIYREITPTVGKIFFENQDLSLLSHHQVPYYRRRLGIVFQDFKLLNYKTVWHNVSYPLEVTLVPMKEIVKRVFKVLKLVGLVDKRNFYPDELSGGEQQQVAIARAIVNNPSLFIADEPTGNLDDQSTNKIMEIINEINKMGTTVIMSTHNMDIVTKFNKRVVYIRNGMIIEDTKYEKTSVLYDTNIV
ncbi:MAG: cell division ATP-binding protein FtsE [Candidatus Calescibacterium sp.]|nr:cell division ATP-binding protein FtsE [Candidatus Calescibacterium sp.]MCX7972472.1 cell division ATP-binding protein FtsE [bacterium]MDW8195636.1 cell division ATP-binding protein FtsE [Candidatus Calescibacterium sp.]